MNLTKEQVDELIEQYIQARSGVFFMVNMLLSVKNTKLKFRKIWRHQNSIQALRFRLEDFVFENSEFGHYFMDKTHQLIQKSDEITRNYFKTHLK